MTTARFACVAVCALGVIGVAGDRGAMPLARRPRRAAPQAQAQTPTEPATFGIGRPATPAEIAALDIDVGPDGAGLPPGRGTAADGAPIYAARCAGCHGKTGKEGPNDVLVGRLPGDAFPFARDPRAPQDHRQLLAVCDDGVRLHPPRDAARRAGIAEGRRGLRPRRVPARR